MRALASYLSAPGGGESPIAGWAPRLKWAALAAAVFVAVALPYGVTSFWVNIATQALIFGLFALSIKRHLRVRRDDHARPRRPLGITGYGAAIFTTHSGWALAPEVVAALAVCAVVSLFVRNRSKCRASVLKRRKSLVPLNVSVAIYFSSLSLLQLRH
jgi:hypothetical protein